MTFSTPTTPPALRNYRTRHTIEVVKDWDDDYRHFTPVCETDGIRVHEVRGGYRHDSGEIKQLAAVERGESVVAW